MPMLRQEGDSGPRDLFRVAGRFSGFAEPARAEPVHPAGAVARFSVMSDQ
ncbi:MAG: hypothetical protein AB7T18_00400 [Alphaproteobacteria bacterium]